MPNMVFFGEDYEKWTKDANEKIAIAANTQRYRPVEISETPSKEKKKEDSQAAIVDYSVNQSSGRKFKSFPLVEGFDGFQERFNKVVKYNKKLDLKDLAKIQVKQVQQQMEYSQANDIKIGSLNNSLLRTSLNCTQLSQPRNKSVNASDIKFRFSSQKAF